MAVDGKKLFDALTYLTGKYSGGDLSDATVFDDPDGGIAVNLQSDPSKSYDAADVGFMEGLGWTYCPVEVARPGTVEEFTPVDYSYFCIDEFL